MAGNALGLIELHGLPAAIVAADIAAKAAAVAVVGRESANGEGRMMITLAGDVGAVTAAVGAVIAQMPRSDVKGMRIIARPSEQLTPLVRPDLPQTERVVKTAISSPNSISMAKSAVEMAEKGPARTEKPENANLQEDRSLQSGSTEDEIGLERASQIATPTGEAVGSDRVTSAEQAETSKRYRLVKSSSAKSQG